VRDDDALILELERRDRFHGSALRAFGRCDGRIARTRPQALGKDGGVGAASAWQR
jgi:hypothetical protein